MAKTILVVDDDQYIRDLYVEILEEDGYTVETAEDGTDALEKIKKTDYDLVLLDIMMPRMDGIEMLRNLKEAKKTAKVVLLTNLAHDPVMNEGKELGALDYIIKADMTPDQLVEKLKTYLK